MNRIRSVRSDGVTRCHPIRGDLRTKEGNLTPRLLAATKFSPPALPNWHVPRHRLHAALDAGANLPLTVVVGAPGAGKSVVLVSWLHDRPELASIWLSCDARDADPATFWSALTNALVRRWPDRWLDATDLLSEAEPALGDVAVALVNDLATLGEPVVIVIDDFQFASAAAPSVTAFIERLPSNCRVVIGSRTEPQLALYRLRAHGQLLEVRDADLRFTQAEVAAVMLEFGIELNAAEVELLTARTEGWAAGVQMAAVSLRDESVPDLFLTEFEKTPRSITDFLGSEVLERQPAEILDFLLATSVLEHLDADSCMAVTERRDAGALLERVEERHLFLIELARGTYRYHHLFSDLLRHRLHADDPDREHALHRRAAEFFIDAGDIESAFGHFLMAGEEAEAFELLRSSFVDAYIQGDGRVLHRLAAKVGTEAATGDPGRLVDVALALAASAPCRPSSTVDHPCAATAPATSTMPTGLDSCSRERSLGRNTEKPTRSNERCPTMADQRTSTTTKSLSTGPSCSRAPGCGSATSTAHARQCEQNLDPLAAPSLQQVGLTGALAWVACVEGLLTEADHLADRALRSAESVGLAAHTAMVDALRTRGRVAFERGDLVAAERVLEQSLSVSEDCRPAFALVSQLSLSRVWLADGRVGEALSGVERARAFLRPDSTSPLLGLCHALEGRIAIENGDLDRAARCRAEPAVG